MRRLFFMLLCLLMVKPILAEQNTTTQAQRQINIARKMIDDKRNTSLAFNMTFTAAEKEKFWPLYREYREAMGKVENKRLAVIVDYASHLDSMTETKAKKLLDQSLSAEKETTRVKQKYVGKFRRILPETKVVRLMQLEHRMDIMVDVKIAENIPLMEQ